MKGVGQQILLYRNRSPVTTRSIGQRTLQSGALYSCTSQIPHPALMRQWMLLLVNLSAILLLQKACGLSLQRPFRCRSFRVCDSSSLPASSAINQLSTTLKPFAPLSEFDGSLTVTRLTAGGCLAAGCCKCKHQLQVDLKQDIEINVAGFDKAMAASLQRPKNLTPTATCVVDASTELREADTSCIAPGRPHSQTLCRSARVCSRYPKLSTIARKARAVFRALLASHDLPAADSRVLKVTRLSGRDARGLPASCTCKFPVEITLTIPISTPASLQLTPLFNIRLVPAIKAVCGVDSSEVLINKTSSWMCQALPGRSRPPDVLLSRSFCPQLDVCGNASQVLALAAATLQGLKALNSPPFLEVAASQSAAANSTLKVNGTVWKCQRKVSTRVKVSVTNSGAWNSFQEVYRKLVVKAGGAKGVVASSTDAASVCPPPPPPTWKASDVVKWTGPKPGILKW